ncbi:CocE/NonD family hydrolase, partial [Pseudomonas sp. BAgro211]|nr:CocE/NonD family hydrolase [Pseudomonas sp. BAgro211]
LGYACLVFDYRHFGDSEGMPRQLLDVKKQLQDWKAAVAFVRTQKEVNGRRVILWGTSFSGGHVLSTAAEDMQVAAVVSQCPFTDGVAS